jgi:phage baseplate assembly protein W
MADGKDFLGKGWSFPPTFHIDNNQTFQDCYVKMVAAREDIEQSLYILLSTSLRERVMQPLYGCNLQDYQFESMSSTLVGFIRDLVTKAILYHEARITVENISVSQSGSWDAIQGYLRINIDYIIRASNSRFNYVYDFYIREASADGLHSTTGIQ